MTAAEDLANLEYLSLLDSLGAGLLVFDAKDKLVLDNRAAQQILNTNLVLVRTEGWSAIAMLIDANIKEQPSSRDIRNQALNQDAPVRFSMLLSGSYTPCWASSFSGKDDQKYVQILIERPDWSALTELLGTFRSEAQSAVSSTAGHADFVRKLLKNPPKNISLEEFGGKALGMVDVISRQMFNLQLLMDDLHRLEIIRTGQLSILAEEQTRKIDIEDFVEDFVEELGEVALVDPILDQDEYRNRLVIDIDENLYISASRNYLRNILRDVVRNAFMYSEPPTPVIIRATLASQGRHVEFSVVDEGCGIRQRETERVFQPFQRARQPQVIREHGYGLSLYLAKAEVEAMGGRIWFESEEGVGTTFSFKLPTYKAG